MVLVRRLFWAFEVGKNIFSIQLLIQLLSLVNFGMIDDSTSSSGVSDGSAQTGEKYSTQIAIFLFFF